MQPLTNTPCLDPATGRQLDTIMRVLPSKPSARDSLPPSCTVGFGFEETVAP